MDGAYSQPNMDHTYSKPTVQAVATAMIVLASCAFFGRLILRLSTATRRSRPQPEDYTLTLAYIFFLTLCTCDLIVLDAAYRLQAVENGEAPLYPTLHEDAVFTQKLLALSATEMYWWSLWTVKFSLLLLYRRLMNGLPHYLRLWWVVTGYCLFCLAACMVGNFTSCRTMYSYVVAPETCNTEWDRKSTFASLIYSYIFDVSADLLIMILPIRLIYRLRLPVRERIGLAATFGIGFVCIAAATVRLVSVQNVIKNRTVDEGRVALWAIIESSIAIIVGCLPAYVVTLRRTANSSRNSNATPPLRGKYGNTATVGSGSDKAPEMRDGQQRGLTARRDTWMEGSLLRSTASEEEIIKKPDDVLVLRTFDVESTERGFLTEGGVEAYRVREPSGEEHHRWL